MEPKHNNTEKYICAAIIGVSIIIGAIIVSCTMGFWLENLTTIITYK